MFIGIKHGNKYKSLWLVLMGSILSIYEVMLQKISKMSHFERRVVRPDVGRWCLIIHMRLPWIMKLSTIYLTATTWKSRGSQICNAGSITQFRCIEVYIHLLMRIICVWLTPHKADGRSPDTSCAFLGNILISWVYCEWWDDFSEVHRNQMEQR